MVVPNLSSLHGSAKNRGRSSSSSRTRSLKLSGWFRSNRFSEEREQIWLQKSPTVLLERTDWLWKVFLPQGSDKDHEAVNVSGPNAVDISGLEYPETVVFVGGSAEELLWVVEEILETGSLNRVSRHDACVLCVSSVVSVDSTGQGFRFP